MLVSRLLGAACGAVLLMAAVGPALADRPDPRPAAAGPRQLGPASNLPVPRFVSLREEGANGRRGPSTGEPVEWVYEQAGIPLQVTGESGPWRRVRDPDGTQTWMHASNLDERRTVFVRPPNGGDAALRYTPRESGRVRAYLAPGLTGALTGCEGDWRRIAVGMRVGWVHRSALWAADDCARL